MLEIILILVIGFSLGYITSYTYYKRKNTENTDPKVNEKWVLKKANGDPFNNENPPVTILSIKSGWVKYKYKHLSSNTLSIDMFVNLYALHTKSANSLESDND